MERPPASTEGPWRNAIERQPTIVRQSIDAGPTRPYTVHMSDEHPNETDAAADASGTTEAAQTQPPLHDPHTRWAYALIAIVALSLLFGLWGLWSAVFSPAGADRHGSDRARVEALEQQVTTLTRSEQITRDANLDLQNALAEREEEIAGLRADVAFYERFVGATAQRRGLTIHDLGFRPADEGRAWHFTATLTQTLNRGAISSGRMRLAVEGTRDGRPLRLEWAELRPETDSTGLDYSFRYFQQVQGTIVLPEGFTPIRVHARLQPASGANVEQSFIWDDTSTARSAAGA